MNDNLIERAEKLLDGITPGPWSYTDVIRNDHNVTVNGWDVAACRAGDMNPAHGDRSAQAARNAEFIAAAPELARELLAEVRQLREWKQLHSADVLSVRNEQAEVEEQRDDALAEVKRLRDVMDELTDGEGDA